MLNKLPGACREVGCGLDAKMIFDLIAESWRVSVILFLCAELCCLGRVSYLICYALKKLGSGRAKTPLPLEGGRAVD